MRVRSEESVSRYVILMSRGPLHFLIFIINLTNELEGLYLLFAGDMKLIDGRKTGTVLQGQRRVR